MSNMNEILDKTYVLYVLETLDCTAYQLAKRTGISNETFSRVKQFKDSLSWKTITTIENETGIEFKSPAHMLFSAQYLDKPELNEKDVIVQVNNTVNVSN